MSTTKSSSRVVRPATPFSTTLLAVERIDGGALDIAEVREGDHHVLVLDQVLHVDFGFVHRELGTTFVAEAVADFRHFLLDDGVDQFRL